MGHPRVNLCRARAIITASLGWLLELSATEDMKPVLIETYHNNVALFFAWVNACSRSRSQSGEEWTIE